MKGNCQRTKFVVAGMTSLVLNGVMFAVAGLGITIQFDYRFDSNNFFGDPNRKAALEAAEVEIGSRLTDHLVAIEPN